MKFTRRAPDRPRRREGAPISAANPNRPQRRKGWRERIWARRYRQALPPAVNPGAPAPLPKDKRPVKAIKRTTLRLICEASKDQHPTEFAAVLRAEKGTITEIMPLPGTVSGDHHAILNTWMLPVDMSVCGVVHSHPSPDYRWSGADLEMFAHFGHTHIILAFPYTEGSWQAYDHVGNVIELEVVD